MQYILTPKTYLEAGLSLEEVAVLSFLSDRLRWRTPYTTTMGQMAAALNASTYRLRGIIASLKEKNLVEVKRNSASLSFSVGCTLITIDPRFNSNGTIEQQPATAAGRVPITGAVSAGTADELAALGCTCVQT